MLLASTNALAKSVFALINAEANFEALIVPVAILASVTAPALIESVTTLPAAIFEELQLHH